MSKFKKKNSAEKVKQLKFYMLISYAVIIILVLLTVSFFVIRKTDAALKSKVSSMTSALNVQMKMNINSYLEQMETTGTLVFTEETVYTYNAADESNDDYEALKTESLISDKLYSICIMENFVDFGIVYANNHVVGKLSNGTAELFGNRIYEDMSAMITRQKTSDGWFTGYGNDYKRIYYVKRINDGAVLVTSFYTTELQEVFEHPGGIDDMTVQLLDCDYHVIYSSNDDEMGQALSDEIYSRIADKSSVTVIDDDYLVTVNDCGDEWHVVCYVPTNLILKEKNEVTYYVFIIGIAAAAVAMLIGLLLLNKIIKSMSNIVTALDSKAKTDLLTGVLNKRTFEELVDVMIERSKSDEMKALILLDVDNFKGINDTLGHVYGDKVLADIGDTLRKVFGKDECIGRLGGDEFCVFMKIPYTRRTDCAAYVEEKCAALCAEFKDSYTGDKGDYKISVSLGASLFPEHGTAFSKLYQCADRALYSSKHKGKDTYTLFNK